MERGKGEGGMYINKGVFQNLTLAILSLPICKILNSTKIGSK